MRCAAPAARSSECPSGGESFQQPTLCVHTAGTTGHKHKSKYYRFGFNPDPPCPTDSILPNRTEAHSCDRKTGPIPIRAGSCRHKDTRQALWILRKASWHNQNSIKLLLFAGSGQKILWGTELERDRDRGRFVRIGWVNSVFAWAD